MHIVPAGVHDSCIFASVGQVGSLGYGERIEFGSVANKALASRIPHREKTRGLWNGNQAPPQRRELCLQVGGGMPLLRRELWVGMHTAPHGLRVTKNGLRNGHNELE